MVRLVILLVGAMLLGIFFRVRVEADNGAFSFAIPAEGIVVDGDLGDWPEGIDRQWVRTVQHFDYPTGPDDGFFSFQVAYDSDAQAIYFGFEVHDNSKSPRVASAPEFQDRLGLSLDLGPMVDGDPGEETFNYYFHIRQDFTGWMDRIMSGWNPVGEIATIAHRSTDSVWWVEMRLDIAALSKGKAVLRPGVHAGVDFEFYDVDQDGTASDYLWGRGVGRYERKAYGDLFLLGNSERLETVSGRIGVRGAWGPLLRDFVHLRSVKHPDWPPIMIVADEEGRFERLLPVGDYSTLAASPDQIQIEATSAARSIELTLDSHEGHSVPLLAASPVVKQALSWGGMGEWLAVDLRELYPGILVTAVAIDADEELWFGSNIGLFHYDGFEYVHYPLLETNGLHFDQMEFDHLGRLWIVDSNRGVFRFEGGHLTDFADLDPILLRMDELFVADDGAVWFVGMLGGACFREERFQLLETVGGYRIAGAESIVISSQGSVWIAGPSNRLHRYFDGRLEEVPGWEQDRTLLRASYGSLTVDSFNRIYVNAKGGRIMKYDDAGALEEVQVAAIASLGDSIVELELGAHGSLWAVGTSDVFQIGSNGEVLSGNELGLEFSSVDRVVCSSHDQVWVASTYDGVACFRNNNVERVPLPSDARRITSAVRLRDRDWLFGTASSGLVRVRDGASSPMSVWSTEQRLLSDQITALENDGVGGVWIGTDVGVGHLSESGDLRHWKTDPRAPQGAVTAMVLSVDRQLWVGTSDGLFRYSAPDWEQVDLRPAGSRSIGEHVLALQLNSDGNLWVSSSSALSVWNEGGFVERVDLDELSAGLLRELCVSTESSRFWVGTGGSGVYRYEGNPGLGKVEHFTVEQGLSDVEITCMLHDSLGRTWVGTKNGLNRIEGRTVVSLGVSDGLPSGKISDLVELENGSILVATYSGAVVYTPALNSPQLRVRMIESQNGGGGAGERQAFAGDSVSFELQSYSTSTSAQQMRYVYRLAGEGGEWLPTSTSRVSFDALPAGDYELEVLALDRDLNPSPEIARMSFAVVYPYTVWLQRIAMTLGGFIALSSLGFAVQRGRQRNQARSELVRRTLEHNTSLIKAREEADQAREAAESANRAKSQFLANISHEIRTPMNAIVGFSRFFSDPNLKRAKRLQLAASVDRSSRYLLELVNDLLDFSKIESGTMELEYEVFDLHSLIGEVAEVHEPRCVKKSLQWKSASDRIDHALFKGDLKRIKQILFNLLGNAIKFTESGFVSLDVTDRVAENLSAQSSEPLSGLRWVRFEVRDSGRGISQEDREAIFGSFVQGRMGKEKGGTGLGLAIAHRLVRLMKGRLSVESGEGQGSLFVFEVPLSVVERRRTADLASKPTDSQMKSAVVSDDAEVLVVDDNPDNRLLLRMLLTPMGASVVEAEDGLSALERLHSSIPSLVLLDLRMPGMNGYEVLERIRGVDRWSKVPLVAVTASAYRHEQELCLKSGFDGFISKPVDAGELTQLIARFMGDRLVKSAEDEQGAVSGVDEPYALEKQTLDQLKMLAQQYRRTELSEAFRELGRTGHEGLAERCLSLVASGDWESLIAILDSCEVLSNSEGSAPCDYSGSSKV